MANRYQDQPVSADDAYDRDDSHPSSRAESDPLAELARLIGQTDPFATMGRANQPMPPHGPAARDPYPPAESDDGPPAGPPPWLQRVARQEAPQQDYPSAVHPLQRYATPIAAPEPDYPQASYADHEPDPSRYDDALYGQIESDAPPPQHDPAYRDDAYGYQDGYDDGAEEPAPKRRSGMVTVAAFLALGILGTGAAYAYRTYVSSPRSGDPPIIKADTTPIKIVPAGTDGSSKLPDRLAAGDGTEKIVPREEAPVDVNAAANAKPGPRMVLPPLSQNPNPPSVASVAPGSPMPPATMANGTLPSNPPRPVKTFLVHGDEPDATALPTTSAPTAPAPRASAPPPAAKPARAASRASTANANASSANAPLSLSPQGQQAPEPRTRVATNSPVQIEPPASAAASGGGYLVQVSSQRNEADAQASYRVLQGKFPSVLGSRSPVIRKADLGGKGIYYRAMVGPFGTAEEASQFCGSLKSAGGQCVVQRK